MVVYLMATRKRAEQFGTYEILTETETKGQSNLSTIDLRSTIDSAVNDPDGPLLKYTARPGMIVMWHSPEPPDGWALCNGIGLLSDKKTPIPNLTGRFPLGVDGTHAINTLGGNSTVTLTVNQIPPHTHTMPFTGWNHGENGGGDMGGTYYWSNGDQAAPVANQAAPITSTGGGKPFDIMPPYATVYFIIKL